MSDTQYKPYPFRFKSKGLLARYALDAPPDFSYFALLTGALERVETALGTRYGNIIINRDPLGVGTSNYLLPAAPVTLSRLLSFGNPYRYAGLADGSLYRRSTDTQGAYSQILAPGTLSGNPFSTLTNNCYETAQPYLFIYDRQYMCKDSGTGTPTRLGIFPPLAPVSAQNYAPLLNVIDAFTSSAGYSTGGGLTVNSLESAYTTQGINGNPQLYNGVGVPSYYRYGFYAPSSSPYYAPIDGMLCLSSLADGYMRLKFQTNVLTEQFDIFAPNSAYTANDTFTFKDVDTTVPSSSTGTLSKTVSLDLSAYDPADLIVLVIAVTAPQNVQEIRVMFDVNGSNYGASFYSKTLIPYSYQGYLNNPLTGSAVLAVNNQIYQQSVTANSPQTSGPGISVRQNMYGTPVLASKVGTLNLIDGGGEALGVEAAKPAQIGTGSGNGAWSVIYLQKGDFLPVGTAGQQGLDWSNITGWRVQITTNTSGSSNVKFNALYMQGGGTTGSPVVPASGPSSFAGVGYDFRVRYYNANTGTPSNGSIEQLFAVTAQNPGGVSTLFPLRQAVAIAGLYSPDPQTTHCQVYVKGGLFGSNWFYADQFVNDPTVYSYSIASISKSGTNITLVTNALGAIPSSWLALRVQDTVAVAGVTNPAYDYPTYYIQQISISGNQLTLVLYSAAGALSPSSGGTVTLPSKFNYVYSLPDSILAESDPLPLDMDVPVTSSLPVPLNTILVSPILSYNPPGPRLFYIQTASSFEFTTNQIVFIGTPYNLEEVRVASGGTGSFFAWVQLAHNYGEPVQCFSVAGQPLYLAENAYGQTWLAGDPNNPHYLYYTNKAYPENCAPQNYIPIGTPGIPITAIINQRGVLFVKTQDTWFQIYPGNPPYAQSTGSKHGGPANFDIARGENEVWYQCLPDSAEALTKNGWKHYTELQVGEDILAYDLEQGNCYWTPAEQINSFDFDGYLDTWRSGKRSQKFEFSFTSEHKWVWRPEPQRKSLHPPLIQQNKNNPRSYNKCACGQLKGRGAKQCWNCNRLSNRRVDRLRSANDIFSGTGGSILQTAHLCGDVDSILDPREAAILGWLVTEGSIVRNQGPNGRRISRIYQAAHSPHVNTIRKLLGEDCTSCQDRITKGKKGTVRLLAFLISTDYTEYLLTKAGFQDKRDLSSIVCKLSFESAKAMFEAMISGDGCRQEKTGRKDFVYFSQKTGPVTEAFRILAFLCGVTTSRPYINKEDVGYTRCLNSSTFDCNHLVRNKDKYSGKVWCPTTRLGTWVARYKDTISITGNSYDGLRTFRGTDGPYMSMVVEWIYRNNVLTPLPLVDLTKLSQVIASYRNNDAIFVYIGKDGLPHRLIYDRVFNRYRNDDIPVTAIYLEVDTNNIVYAKPMTINGVSGWAVVYDSFSQDYDDGGWVSGSLAQLPIPLNIQTLYDDQKAPHNPKQYNVLEIDANPNGQVISPVLLCDDGSGNIFTVVPTPSSFTGYFRSKYQFQINAGQGQQAYRVALQLTASVTACPEIYQADLYAALLADARSSYDSYWISFNSNEEKLVKQGYFDYTSNDVITVLLYADGDTTAYYTFTLPINTTRMNVPMRVRFGNNELGALGAQMQRMFRMVMVSPGTFQLWSPLQVDVKPLLAGKGYKREILGDIVPM